MTNVMAMAGLTLVLAGCGQDRGVQVNPHQLQPSPDAATVVFGVRFAGEVPRVYSPSSVARQLGEAVVATAPLTPPSAQSIKDDRRAVIFQRIVPDRCWFFWDTATALAKFAQRKIEYQAWKVPSGTYAGPPRRQYDTKTDAFAARKGRITYWGDFSIDEDWGVERSSNLDAARRALKVEMDVSPVGETQALSTGLKCGL
jgi:hypothetical protein